MIVPGFLLPIFPALGHMFRAHRKTSFQLQIDLQPLLETCNIKDEPKISHSDLKCYSEIDCMRSFLEKQQSNNAIFKIIIIQ